eukprot:4938257-Pyramimonas_sp.AAC.3
MQSCLSAERKRTGRRSGDNRRSRSGWSGFTVGGRKMPAGSAISRLMPTQAPEPRVGLLANPQRRSLDRRLLANPQIPLV